MLRHANEPENEYVSNYQSSFLGNPCLEADIEDYLDHFSAPLVGKVSYELRTKMRSELRLQIEQIVVAYQELGSSRAEAVAETLQQFRQSAQVAPLVLKQTQTLAPMPLVKSRERWLALKCLGGSTSIAATLFTLMSNGNTLPDPSIQYLILGVMSVCPVIGGLLLGYKNPNRVLREMIKSNFLFAVPLFLFFWSFLTLHFRGARSSPSGMAIAYTAIWTIFSTIIGGVGAKMGIWLRKTNFFSNLMEKIDPSFPASDQIEKLI